MSNDESKTKQPKPEKVGAGHAAAVWAPIGALHEWAKNPRRNNTAVAKVAESIRVLGFGAPIVARQENGEIIAGHTRFKAAKMLGLETVPVRYLDISEDAAHALALGDNKLGEIALWDEELLQDAIGSLEPWGDVSLLGFESASEGDDTSLQSPNIDTDVLGQARFDVVVTCAGSDQQAALYARLTDEGLVCRLLIS